MGKHVVVIERNTTERGDDLVTMDRRAGAGSRSQTAVHRNRSTLKTVVITAFITALTITAIAGGAFYFYWRHLKTTPQYSLALMVDAAKRDDQTTVNDLVDIDTVVDDFLPQITDKAVELYGRGLSAETLQRVARVAVPVMPAVKDRARAELPGAIRQKTSTFADVPFAAMVLGADGYLDVAINGDTATVRSKLPEHNFEVRMVRASERWKIAGVRDEELATRIAQRIGQEIVAIAVNGTGSNKSRLGIRNINELLREAEEIFR